MFVVQPSVNRTMVSGAADPNATPGSSRVRVAARGSQGPLSTSRPEFKLPPATEKAAAPAASGMERLASAMASLGMNSTGLDMKYSEELVWYPGGSYVNRLITVTSGSRTESFSADLTARNPLVTAYEIQKYLGVPGNSLKVEA